MPTIPITSGVSYTVPLDYDPAGGNIIECWGSGASGSGPWWQAGGGAGAYARVTNLPLNAGQSYTINIGAGGARISNPSNALANLGNAGSSTWFSVTGSVPTNIAQGCLANGGSAATEDLTGVWDVLGGAGGAATTWPGIISAKGGNGGNVDYVNWSSASGGGGAAGWNGTAAVAGNNGATNGADGGAGGAGAGISGGAGGTAGVNSAGGAGGSGNAAGGGGGGGDAGNYQGGNGGIAGGGGGPGWTNNSTFTLGGAGGNGLILFTYVAKSYQLPGSGAITMNDINNIWFASNRSITLQDPEIRYLIESGIYNPNNMPLPPASFVDLGTARGKPIPAGGSATYSTPGTYTFYMPVYKFFSAVIKGAGGGEAGQGAGVFNSCASCGFGCAPCTLCPGGTCSSFSGCFSGAACSCCGGGTVYYAGTPGSTGGTSSLVYLPGGGTATTVGSAAGGGGGSGSSLTGNETTGTSGTGSLIIGTGGTTTGGGSAGGSGATNGGNGGPGGSVTTTIQHFVTANYPIWANDIGVTQYTIVVGQGGAGGPGYNGGTAGANGSDGSITITWQ